MLNRRVFCGLAAGVSLLRAQAPGPPEIKIDDLKQRYDRGERLFYLDVREPKELEDTGAIKGYVNIPIGQLEARLSEVPKGQTIVVYCQGGGRAARGAQILQKNGFKTLGYCGLREWKAKNYPVVYPKAK